MNWRAKNKRFESGIRPPRFGLVDSFRQAKENFYALLLFYGAGRCNDSVIAWLPERSILPGRRIPSFSPGHRQRPEEYPRGGGEIFQAPKLLFLSSSDSA